MGTADEMVALCAFPDHVMVMNSSYTDLKTIIDHELPPVVELFRAVQLFERGERFDTVEEAWMRAIEIDRELWLTEYGPRPIELQMMIEMAPYAVLDLRDADELLVEIETNLLYLHDHYVGKLTERQLASLRFYRYQISDLLVKCTLPPQPENIPTTDELLEKVSQQADRREQRRLEGCM